MFINRRKHSRYSGGNSTTITIDGHEIEAVDCRDISVGGMCLMVKWIPEDVETGQIVMKRFVNNERVNFTAQFRKIWSRPAFIDSDEIIMGVLFKHIIPEQMINLHKIIEYSKEHVAV